MTTALRSGDARVIVLLRDFVVAIRAVAAKQALHSAHTRKKKSRPEAALLPSGLTRD
jgi:hypothetical protein